MPLNKKGTRSITVDEQKYRWRTAWHKEDGHPMFDVLVELYTSPGQRLIVRYDPPQRAYLNAFVTPKHVRGLIEMGLKRGWKPEVRTKQLMVRDATLEPAYAHRRDLGLFTFLTAVKEAFKGVWQECSLNFYALDYRRNTHYFECNYKGRLHKGEAEKQAEFQRLAAVKPVVSNPAEMAQLILKALSGADSHFLSKSKIEAGGMKSEDFAPVAPTDLAAHLEQIGGYLADLEPDKAQIAESSEELAKGILAHHPFIFSTAAITDHPHDLQLYFVDPELDRVGLLSLTLH
ncbi:MAG: hypothetical protein AAF570_02985 [Bacteroidota bacterium]